MGRNRVPNIALSREEAHQFYEFTLRYHLNAVDGGEAPGFHLYQQNCTVFLHEACRAARIYVPTQIGFTELFHQIQPDFLKTTGAAQLNTWLFDQGTITHFDDLGDARIFAGATPNCAIWRFEKGNLTHRTNDGRRMTLCGGQLLFARGIYSVPLASVFSVKVGAVSGADDIFTNTELGNTDFVCSKTAATGELRRMIFDLPLPELEAHKERLLARRVTRFDENNWWKWGRRHHVSDAPRIYVNHKTRNLQPFFLNGCKNYDGSILALFPHQKTLDMATMRQLTALLNDIDWAELGFICDGRYLFSQRSLEQSPLPECFAPFAVHF